MCRFSTRAFPSVGSEKCKKDLASYNDRHILVGHSMKFSQRRREILNCNKKCGAAHCSGAI